MEPHRVKNVYDGCSAKNQRHDVSRNAACLERPDDTDGPQSAEGAGERCRKGPTRCETRQTPLERERNHRNQYSDEKVGKTHAEESSQRTSQLDLPLMQCGSVHAPRKNRAYNKHHPDHSKSPFPSSLVGMCRREMLDLHL